MKVVIWFGCIAVYSIIVTALRSAGVLLGAMPTALLGLLLVFLPAPALCKWWGSRKARTAPREEQPKERWYTCQKCGQLVREGETCDCEAVRQQSTDEEPTPVPQERAKRPRLPVVLSVACAVLAVCACALACHAGVLAEERDKLATENRILDATLHDLSDENARLTEEIDTLQAESEPSFSSWSEAYKVAEKDWETLYDAGYITLPFEEWWPFVSETYLAKN